MPPWLKNFWNTQTISGSLLVLGIVITGAGFIVLLVQGKIEGLEAAFKGVEGIGEAASAFRTLEAFTRPGYVLLLLGFGMLTVRLSEEGDHTISILALNLFVVFLVVSVLEGTFHSEVTAWAGQEWARTGTVPEFFEPLRQWVNGPIQLVYMSFGFTSMAAYGWAILRTGVLQRWLGWVTVGWSLAWLIVILVTQDTLPAVVFVPMLLIGVALLVPRQDLGTGHYRR